MEVLSLVVFIPAKTSLDLMRPVGPGEVIADLVAVIRVDPRPPVGFETEVLVPVDIDLGESGLRAAEESACSVKPDPVTASVGFWKPA